MDALTRMDSAAMQGPMQVAAQLAKSELIPRALRGKPQDVLVVLLTGHELGLGPMQALRTIHVVDGKPVLAADLIVGLCLRQRSVCRYFRVVESTDDVATYETHREGSPEPTRLSFTRAQAQAAGLLGKDNWRKYPAAMLRARCAAGLARAAYADLAAGVYDPDELDAPSAAPMTETRSAPVIPITTAPALPSPGPVAKTVDATPAPDALDVAPFLSEPEPEPQTVPDIGEAEALGIAIDEAQTLQALTSVGGRIKAAHQAGRITEAERVALGRTYTTRQAQIRRGA